MERGVSGKVRVLLAVGTPNMLCVPPAAGYT